VCHRFICPAESGRCPVTDLKQTVDTSERVLLTLRGEKIPILKSVITTTLGGKKVLIESFIDITERKQAEEKLKESEGKYRTLVENIPEKIFVKDALLAYVSCNDSYARDLGIAAEAIAGKTDFDFYPRDLAEKYRADDRAVMESGATSTIDERYVLNGVEFWVSTVKTPIRDNAGNISGILGIFHDITEQKRAEEVIRESEERYRTLAEASPDQIFIVGRDDTMKYANTASLKLFRLPYDQVVGTPRKNLFPPDIADAQGILLKKVFETGERIQTEEKIQFGTQELWIDTYSVPLKDKRGNVTAVLGVARDITERKKAEVLLKRFNEELEQKVKARTEELDASLQEKIVLLREIHHRVKNNLQIIISLINLQMRQVDDEQLKQVMAETQNRVRAMSLVHEKLYQSESLSHIDLSDYTRFLATQLFSYYGVNSRKVALDIAIGKVMVDINTAIPLGLIINELVSNALKHAFPSDRKGTITISSRYDDTVLSLVVRDDGIGLPPDLDWKNPESLGLRLVNSLVDQLSGTIELKKEKGTTFIISIHRENG
jgi:PAS domain S-box-containing protein